MLAHIHVTYSRHPNAFVDHDDTVNEFPFKVKVAVNAFFDKQNEYIEDHQIFSSEKYNGHPLGILTSIFDTHIKKANGARVERIKVECKADEDTPDFKYYETHYELDNKEGLSDLNIQFLAQRCIAYSYTINEDGSFKNILTVRSIELEHIEELVISVAKSLLLNVTNHYAEKVVLDTNIEYDNGWAPVCRYNCGVLVRV